MIHDLSTPTVSIHAPVKGATAEASQGAQGGRVSIHAPVKGATGEDSCSISIRKGVSIHAPVKGATRYI